MFCSFEVVLLWLKGNFTIWSTIDLPLSFEEISIWSFVFNSCGYKYQLIHYYFATNLLFVSGTSLDLFFVFDILQFTMISLSKDLFNCAV